MDCGENHEGYEKAGHSERAVGFHEGAQEMVACANHSDAATAEFAYSVYAGVRACTVHLYDILSQPAYF